MRKKFQAVCESRRLEAGARLCRAVSVPEGVEFLPISRSEVCEVCALVAHIHSLSQDDKEYGMDSCNVFWYVPDGIHAVHPYLFIKHRDNN